jgi:hypothetical protein
MNLKRKTASLKHNGLPPLFISNVSWRSGPATRLSPNAWPAQKSICATGIEPKGRPGRHQSWPDLMLLRLSNNFFKMLRLVSSMALRSAAERAE